MRESGHGNAAYTVAHLLTEVAAEVAEAPWPAAFRLPLGFLEPGCCVDPAGSRLGRLDDARFSLLRWLGKRSGICVS